MDERTRLSEQMGDPELSAYFYLEKTGAELVAFLDALELRQDPLAADMPFNAAVKGYQGALDQNGHPWIMKPVASQEELLFHRLCTFAYLIDHESGTLAAPTGVCSIAGKAYRITKVVRKAIQISSYSYLDQPYIGILRADLVNRWLYFDEDRNPNNYLVVHSKKNKPFVVAIDYDKADLAAENMKITGNPDKFGWFRSEKTRFLTLLRPSHFEGVSIDVFDARLKAICGIPESWLRSMAHTLLDGYATPSYAEGIARNIETRRRYINDYFRSMFKDSSETVDSQHSSEYSAFGESFGNVYKETK
jgi:hypothetical protein